MPMTTAEEMHTAINRIFANRSIKAAESQYDRKVCIRAVGTARDAFIRVPIEGTATEYGQAVLMALEPLCDNYNDPDGEYTSGKGSIGDVFYDIMEVVEN